MKVLVTGGAGFVGSHLVDALIDRGDEVFVIDSLEKQVHPNGKPDYLNPKVKEYIFEDYADRYLLEDLLYRENIEAISHQAASVGVGQSMYEIEKYVDNNTRKTALLLDVLANTEHKVKKLVIASSMSIYGEGAYMCPKHHHYETPFSRKEEDMAKGIWEHICPVCELEELQKIAVSENKPLQSTSIYAISKKDQEEMCLCVGRTYNIPTIALRYFNVYGTRQALSNPYTGVVAIFSSRLMNGHSPIVNEDGNQTRDFVNVKDVVQANLKALDYEGEDSFACNIGTGIPTSLNTLLGTLQKELGTEIVPEINGSHRKGDIRHCYADISRAKRFLKYKPTVFLKEGIHELVEWLKTQKPEDNFDKANKELKKKGLLS